MVQKQPRGISNLWSQVEIDFIEFSVNSITDVIKASDRSKSLRFFPPKKTHKMASDAQSIQEIAIHEK